MSQRSIEQHTTDETSVRRPYPRWRTVLVIVVVVLVILMLVALHLSGAVGPGAH